MGSPFFYNPSRDHSRDLFLYRPLFRFVYFCPQMNSENRYATSHAASATMSDNGTAFGVECLLFHRGASCPTSVNLPLFPTTIGQSAFNRTSYSQAFVGYLWRFPKIWNNVVCFSAVKFFNIMKQYLNLVKL